MKKLFFTLLLFVLCFIGSTFAQEKQPKVLKYFAPKYPPAALAIAAKGEVIVAIEINQQGKVLSAKATNGHLLLQKSTEAAAKEWIFSQDENTMERKVRITFVFRIENKKDTIKFKKPYRLEIVKKGYKSSQGLPVLKNTHQFY
jgi:TonB family protein